MKVHRNDMKANVEIKVERALGTKCPRCWNYHTIQGNPLGVCDRCVRAINEMLPDLVADGRWTEADAEEWRLAVFGMVSRWKGST